MRVSCEWTPFLELAGEESLGERREVQRGRLRQFPGGIGLPHPKVSQTSFPKQCGVNRGFDQGRDTIININDLDNISQGPYSVTKAEEPHLIFPMI